MSQASRVLEGRSLQVRKADLLPYVAQLLRPKETQVSYRCSASSSCFTEIGKLLRIMSETRREMAGAILLVYLTGGENTRLSIYLSISLSIYSIKRYL